MRILSASAIALAAATISAPAYAESSTIYDGYGSVSAGYISLDRGAYTYTYCYNQDCSTNTEEASDNYDGLNLNVRTSVSVPLGGAWGAQVDGNFSRAAYDTDITYYEGEEYALKPNESTFAGHVFARNDKRLLGLFVQRTSTNHNFGSGRAVYYAGGEAQAYLGKVTLYGQASYGTHDFTPFHSDIVNLGLQLRYFPEENLKLALGGTYQNEKWTRNREWFGGNSYEENSWERTGDNFIFGLNAEKKLKKSRARIFADFSYGEDKIDTIYRYTYGSETESDAYQYKNSEVRFMVGVKLNFGSTTLLQRDRSGASLDPVRNGNFGFEGYYQP